MRRFTFTVVLTCVLASLMGGTAGARPRQEVMFEVPTSSSQISTLVPKLESLGVTAVRINMPWSSTAPDADSQVRPAGDLTDPARYNWSSVQPLIDAATAHHWKVTLALAGGAPRWATQGAKDHITRPRASDFENFAKAAARQFGTRVANWSIWNEPNFRTFLLPQTVHGKPASPAIYRQLYLAGQKGLKSVLHNPRILFGELAPRSGANGVAPLAFLRSALCLSRTYHRAAKCTKVTAGGFALHPYAPPAGPYFVPANKDDVTIGVLSRLTKALDRAARAHAITSRLRVYLTEFGVQSYPDRSDGVPLSTQADQRSLAERIAWSNPRVYGFSQYLMQDDRTIHSRSRLKRYPGFQSGLETDTGKAKPAYAGFRLPLVVTRSGRRVALWGFIRPATGGATKATVQYARRGKPWRTLKHVTTKSDHSFTFSGSYAAKRLWRLTWTSPSGQTFVGSTTAAHSKP